jgi:hypothetical protein
VIVFGSAGAVAMLMMSGFALALTRLGFEFEPLFGDVDLGLSYTGATAPPQPPPTCAALAEVRDAAAQAYDAHLRAMQPPARPVPPDIKSALTRLDNALAFAISTTPPLLQEHLQATRHNVQLGRIAAALAADTVAYRRATTDAFFTGGFAFLRADERLGQGCPFELMP